MASTTIFGRAARLRVTPAPSTLSDTLCILKHLDTFGPVETFLNSRYIPAILSERGDSPSENAAALLAIFSSREALSTAIGAAPLTISTGLDTPNPRNEDPYNIRGLHDRIPIPQKTFKCTIEPDPTAEAHHATLIKQRAQSDNLALERDSPLLTDLLQSGAPSDALALIPMSLSRLSFQANPSSKIHERISKPITQSLAAVYAQAMNNRAHRPRRNEAEVDKMRLRAKREKTESNRLYRHLTKWERDKVWYEIQRRRAANEQELRERWNLDDPEMKMRESDGGEQQKTD